MARWGKVLQKKKKETVYLYSVYELVNLKQMRCVKNLLSHLSLQY